MPVLCRAVKFAVSRPMLSSERLPIHGQKYACLLLSLENSWTSSRSLYTSTKSNSYLCSDPISLHHEDHSPPKSFRGEDLSSSMHIGSLASLGLSPKTLFSNPVRSFSSSSSSSSSHNNSPYSVKPAQSPTHHQHADGSLCGSPHTCSHEFTSTSPSDGSSMSSATTSHSSTSSPSLRTSLQHQHAHPHHLNASSSSSASPTTPSTSHLSSSPSSSVSSAEAIGCSSRQTDNPRCWSCPVRTPHHALFCKHCGVIQPPAKQDYFSLFKVPLSFNVNEAELDRRFKQLQTKIHPDKFSCKSGQEQAYSSQHAAELNSAYSTLKDPLARGRYLLSLKAPRYLELGAVTTSQAMLMDVLDVREELEDTHDVTRLMEMFRENVVKMDTEMARAAHAFEREDYLGAAKALADASYWCSVEVEIRHRVPGDLLATAIKEDKEEKEESKGAS